MNLLKIYEEVKELNESIRKEKEEIKKREFFKTDLVNLVKGIMDGDEKVSICSDVTYITLGLKNVKKRCYSTIEAYCLGQQIPIGKYEVKLTKSNIKKIENYINNNGFHS